MFLFCLFSFHYLSLPLFSSIFFFSFKHILPTLPPFFSPSSPLSLSLFASLYSLPSTIHSYSGFGPGLSSILCHTLPCLLLEFLPSAKRSPRTFLSWVDGGRTFFQSVGRIVNNEQCYYVECTRLFANACKFNKMFSLKHKVNSILSRFTQICTHYWKMFK